VFLVNARDAKHVPGPSGISRRALPGR
jgi:hypothetical protein